MPFTRRTGRARYKTFPSADTISEGTLVQFDESGEVIDAKTAKAVLGIAVGASTSSTNQTVDILSSGDVVATTLIVGTMASTDIGEDADIVTGGETMTLTVSNGDAVVEGWDGNTTTNSATAYILFKNLAYGASGAAAEST